MTLMQLITGALLWIALSFSLGIAWALLMWRRGDDEP